MSGALVAVSERSSSTSGRTPKRSAFSWFLSRRVVVEERELQK